MTLMKNYYLNQKDCGSLVDKYKQRKLMQIIKFFLRNTLQDRKGNLPQWDSNPMPLICQTSALTPRPQRIPDLSQITYPSDSCVVTEL